MQLHSIPGILDYIIGVFNCSISELPLMIDVVATMYRRGP